MYLDQYFEAVEACLRRVRETQRGAIEQVAQVLADALANKGVLAVMDTGHLLKYESMYRAGGLLAIVPFSYDLVVDNDMLHRKTERSVDEQLALEARKVGLALDASNLRAGDVLLINSNSGRTPNVIEAALQARARGIVTIGLASREQMERCTPAHPSGKKLLEVVDHAIDNGSPYGDAAVAVKDNEKMCPLSGIASAYVLWAIQAHAVERLQAAGVNPSIYRSNHVSGQAFVDAQRAAFAERGL